MSSRKAYNGSRRKILLAFDVGTTYSGISYGILDPGQISGINPVTRFPAQETISGASKIPSVIYYDKEGEVRAVGAEAVKDGIYEAALEGDWCKAEWFKLHLRSKYGSGKNLHPNVPPLPPNKTVVDVFADFLRYLFSCASAYIQDTHPNGRELFRKSHSDDIYFVLSHPNGWEGKEQSQMRNAAVMAGLIPDDQSGHSRLTFVTEGEASLHFAIENGVLSQAVPGEGVVIVDAGGGTIDISTYKRDGQENKRIFEEIAVPECYFYGSVFVTFNARDFLKDLLTESSFLNDIDHITDCFDKYTKPRFRNDADPQYIKFGSTRDNDPTCGIRFGQLKLAGSDVARFFQSSINCVVQAVLDQIKSAQISHVILVGGFAASDWLYERVKAVLTREGLVVIRPSNHVNKAVSDGAISFYLDHYVRTRVAKVTYGTEVLVRYNHKDPEHVKRAAMKFTHVDGTVKLRHAFRTVLPKNTQVSETKEFVKPLHKYLADPTKISELTIKVKCYRGDQKNPGWIDTEPEKFTTACTLVADLSQVPRVQKLNPTLGTFYHTKFDLILLFGLTELQAQLRWKEKGIERRSSARLIYDEV